MMNDILVLAQDNALFNLRNLIMVICIVVLIVGYKMYKNKTMS